METHKKVLVIGSSPGVKLPDNLSDYYTIACNASLANYPEIVPDILFINGVTLKTDKGIGPLSRKFLEGRHADTLVVIDNQVEGFVQRRIAELGMGSHQTIFLSKEDRVKICESVSGIHYEGLAGGDIVPSTGVSAICYALNYVDEVFITGIDIKSSGHSYGESTYPREHVAIDYKTLTNLAGKVKDLYGNP